VPKRVDPVALLDALNEAGVEYIVVGGAAAVMQGAPVTTQDVDIVPRVSGDNLSRLTRVLQRLHATVREPGARQLPATEDLLMAGGQVRLLSDLGPIDVLGRLHDGSTYEQLLAHSEVIGDDVRRVRVVDLPTLIQIKESTGRRSDQFVVPILREILRRRG
jgi:predicted nucleotidyltransferase